MTKTQKKQPSGKQYGGSKKQPVTANKNEASYSKYFLPSILIITSLVFSNTLFNDFINNWDDRDTIINNPVIKELNWQSIKEILMHFKGTDFPITILSYAIDYKLFGLNPFFFHLTNYLLHLLNVLLVYLFIKRITTSANIAFITALFFGIHPMHVESVAWITERKDLLYSLFFLLSLNSYHKYLSLGNKNYNLLWSLFWFILSILSKPAAACLPLVLVLMDYYRNKRITLKSIISVLPFIAVVIIIALVTFISQNTFDEFSDLNQTFNVLDRIFLFSYSVIYYLIKVIIPLNLSILHYYPTKSGGFLPFEYYVSLPVLISIVWFIYKSKLMRNELIFGLLFYFFTIVLVLQIMPFGQAIVSERYTYIPYIGIFFILGQFYSFVKENKFSYSRKFKPFLLPILVLFASVFSYLSFQRNKVWENGIILFSDSIKKYPEQGYGWWARGNGYLEIQDYKSALSDYDTSILLGSGDEVLFTNRGIVKVNLGYFDEALPDYNMALKFNPGYDEAWFNRGTLFLATGKYEKAISDLTIAIQHKPGYFEAYCNRGAAYAHSNMMNESLKDFNKAIELNPDFAEAYFNRGFTKNSLNDSIGACSDWSIALRLGYANAGNALSMYCK